MSECCSCETQRGEDDDIPYNKSLVYYSNFNAPCLAGQVSTSDAPEYMAGTYVWTRKLLLHAATACRATAKRLTRNPLTSTK